jgi:large subunit ribosomal protein L4
MAIPTFTKAGTKATTPAKLDKAVFGVAPTNHELLKQVYTAYLSNGRTNNAITKKRGEVSGGGRKPWKQKGTGRARFGSTRNPIWRGGGIAFGPSGSENFTKDVNVKAKRLAIRQALSLAAEANKIIVLENLALKEGKTAEMARFLTKIGASRKILVVVDTFSDELILATNNLRDVKLVRATYLNVYDVMNADSIVVTDAALSAISQWLATPAKPAASKATADKEGEK